MSQEQPSSHSRDKASTRSGEPGSTQSWEGSTHSWDRAVAGFPAQLREAFGEGRVHERAPLAPFTTFKVGGPAEWLLDVTSAEELERACKLARLARVPVTVLGGGSNVLISDQGIPGLVIRVRGGRIDELARVADRGTALVRADAGVTINALVRWTINRGLAGLEAWAGTPGSIGGGVFGNAHFGGRLLSELVDHVRLVAPGGEVRDVRARDMEFAYDRSRLQHTGEVLLWAVLGLIPGSDPAALRAVARQSLAYRKQTQPLETPSAGCIFRNPDPAIDPLPADVPASAGALVDRAGLKGRSIGGATVSAAHGNFIVNHGGATAHDIRALVKTCQQAVRDRFGVWLREEIVYLGSFED
ncbi:MAG: UDP-N-acetylmuramate dehydrogenase [Acidobacteria bacterium]|nr:UDP-N-acetylmuramate dehydrogenase [Acidobacteriota bacterium]